MLDYLIIFGSDFKNVGLKQIIDNKIQKLELSALIIGNCKDLIYEDDLKKAINIVGKNTKIIIAGHGINYDDNHHIQILASIDTDDIYENPMLKDISATSKLFKLLTQLFTECIEFHLFSCSGSLASKDVIYLPNKAVLLTYVKADVYAHSSISNVFKDIIQPSSVNYQIGDLFIEIISKNMVDIKLSYNDQGKPKVFNFDRTEFPNNTISHINHKILEFQDFCNQNKLKLVNNKEIKVDEYDFSESYKYLLFIACTEENLEKAQILIDYNPELINANIDGYELTTPFSLILRARDISLAQHFFETGKLDFSRSFAFGGDRSPMRTIEYYKDNLVSYAINKLPLNIKGFETLTLKEMKILWHQEAILKKEITSFINKQSKNLYACTLPSLMVEDDAHISDDDLKHLNIDEYVKLISDSYDH